MGCSFVLPYDQSLPFSDRIVIETPNANLSEGMRQLNGVYTMRFNRKRGRVGHLFQGRYKAILVDKAAYLLELSRYVVLNHVRAKTSEYDLLVIWQRTISPRPAWARISAGLSLVFDKSEKGNVMATTAPCLSSPMLHPRLAYPSLQPMTVH